MRVLVTGGAGFIGGHIVDLLVAGGHEVVVLDNLDAHAHAGVPSYLNPHAHYESGDVTDASAWRRVLPGIDAISHQAAMVGLGVDFDDVRRYVDTNDGGTAAGLWAMHHMGFRGRFVLASSMVVYGEGGYRCPTHGEVRPGPRAVDDLERGCFEPRCPACAEALDPFPINETAPLDPRNIYAATKVHQEHLAAAFAREHDASVIALRYHNVYGPRMPRDTPYAGVASIFRSAVEAGAAPRVFEDGGQIRDFVHVQDVAAANLLALTAPPEESFIACNIASGEPHTIGELADVLCAAAPRSVRPVRTGQYRLGDVRHVFADTGRATRLLDYRPSVSFETGMREFASAPLRS